MARNTKTLLDGRKQGSGRLKGSLSGARTMEAILLTTLNSGDSFYTDKMDKDMTAIAVYYQAKITTERLYVIDAMKEILSKITKVTIIEPSKRI
jgi:hypothetical protein